MFDKFLQEMLRYVPGDARVMACQFRGDPNSDIYGKWRSRPIRDVSQVDDLANVYLCVSAMKATPNPKNNHPEFRRRKANFTGGLLLMIDDVGSGKGAKFPLETLTPLPPTALVETSPDNFQACYFFDSLVDDIDLMDALIRAFIQKEFLGADTGMAGVNRVFRPPAGINGKEKYKVKGKPWRVVMHDWSPKNRYSVQEIAQAFELVLLPKNPMPKHEGTVNAAKGERIRNFITVRAALRGAGMIKSEQPDYSGWIHIQCPWLDEHSDRADTGAAIRVPDAENDWYGAFRCHHGHCEGKGWRHLTEWLSWNVEQVLADVNANAPAKLKELGL